MQPDIRRQFREWVAVGWPARPAYSVPVSTYSLVSRQSPGDQSPGEGTIVLQVDESLRRWQVRLPEGISEVCVLLCTKKALATEAGVAINRSSSWFSASR
jgi:hypothetical protein